MSQDWDEVEALRVSLREHMAEIKRLNECLTWEQHRAEHVGTHGPGCAEWGPKHYECLLLAHKALKERTHREDRTVGATIKDCLIVEPVAYVTGYFDGKCVIKPIEPVVLLPVGMALYRAPTMTEQESRQVEPVGYFSINSYGNWEQNESGYGTPLYEAPPKREPLTDEEIRLIDSGTNFHEASDWSLRFARAIERAHGIGGEK